MGRHGVYYQQTISRAGQGRSHASPRRPRPRPQPSPADDVVLEDVTGATTFELAAASPSDPGQPGQRGGRVRLAVLRFAPDSGISIPELVTETGMSRRWIYYRLEELVAVGRVVQVGRGLWCAVTADGDDNE